MLQKILIANRGEIAVRVIRAAREMGIPTVAVYSELDRDALHVRLADEAYALGGQTAAESYINTEAILTALRDSGADSVHPGYGFFSENADFARAVADLGVTFIGPPPEAMDEMSDKVSSTTGGDARRRSDRARYDRIRDRAGRRSAPSAMSSGGRPCIKAAYGGGGRGMKIVHSRRRGRCCVRLGAAPNAKPSASSGATRCTSSGI